MAARKKKVSAKKVAQRQASSTGSFELSIDLNALEQLYKSRYVVSLDGSDGDTKGSISISDGDTKGGIVIRDGIKGRFAITDGDTKGGIAIKDPTRGTVFVREEKLKKE